jgi:alginate O-acetyltransferase complex protein AlgI
VFIGYFDIGAALLVIVLTLYSYLFANLITSKKNKSFYHKSGIIGLLLVLVIFKYLGLLSNTINSLSSFIGLLPKIETIKILPLLGVSYITFKLISYLTDIYWGITGKGKFIDVLCYASLFTIYTAGPIERFNRFSPQINNVIKFNKEYVEYAFQRIVFGLFKKLVIADWIGYLTAPVWENQSAYSEGIKALALLGFSIQIYLDFSAYSDIAIGSSRLFGLKIMENFDYPYISNNISRFWAHWHISLSEWIRDYIFFPLSQLSRKKIWMLFFVPVITMALCGIWHGSAWHFMIWGVWHGAGISAYQMISFYKKKKKIRFGFEKSGAFKIAGIVFTFIFVTAGWWWFI